MHSFENDVRVTTLCREWSAPSLVRFRLETDVGSQRSAPLLLECLRGEFHDTQESTHKIESRQLKTRKVLLTRPA